MALEAPPGQRRGRAAAAVCDETGQAIQSLEPVCYE